MLLLSLWENESQVTASPLTLYYTVSERSQVTLYAAQNNQSSVLGLMMQKYSLQIPESEQAAIFWFSILPICGRLTAQKLLL